MLWITVIYFISLIIFLIISYNKLKKEIFQILSALNHIEIKITHNPATKKQNKNNKTKTKISSNKNNLKLGKKKKKNVRCNRDKSNQK